MMPRLPRPIRNRPLLSVSLLVILLAGLAATLTHEERAQSPFTLVAFDSLLAAGRVAAVQVVPSRYLTVQLRPVSGPAAVSDAASLRGAATRPRTGPATLESFHLEYPIPLSDAMLASLRVAHVDVSFAVDRLDATEKIGSFLLSVAFLLFLIPILRAQSRGNATAVRPGERPNVTFDDVAGIDDAKQELQEIVDFLKDPVGATRLGASVPHGALLMGPPGNGKTLLAQAVAGTAGVPFYSISASAFVEMFVGVGAKRVRELFAKARDDAPAVIFIDEIDALARHRGSGGHDEREQTLNQLLIEMSGFRGPNAAPVVVLAATNRPDVLDAALLRPGRFDRQVTVSPPTRAGRLAILQVHVRRKGIPLHADVDLDRLAQLTPGASGAELENLLNEAALVATRATPRRQSVTWADMEWARDKHLLGAARPGVIMSDAERRTVAIHEAGHAVVGAALSGNGAIHKVTIQARGRSLGVAHFSEEIERHLHTERELNHLIAKAMGGRAAEMLCRTNGGSITSGAESDIEVANRYARMMITKWGMGAEAEEETGPNFVATHIAGEQVVSDMWLANVDRSVRELVVGGLAKALETLEDRRAALDALAEQLLEHETLDGDAVRVIMERHPATTA